MPASEVYLDVTVRVFQILNFPKQKFRFQDLNARSELNFLKLSQEDSQFQTDRYRLANPL